MYKRQAPARAHFKGSAVNMQRPSLRQRHGYLAARARVNAGDGRAGHAHAKRTRFLRQALIVHQAQGFEFVHLQNHSLRVRGAERLKARAARRGADTAAFPWPGHTRS